MITKVVGHLSLINWKTIWENNQLDAFLSVNADSFLTINKHRLSGTMSLRVAILPAKIADSNVYFSAILGQIEDSSQ